MAERASNPAAVAKALERRFEQLRRNPKTRQRVQRAMAQLEIDNKAIEHDLRVTPEMLQRRMTR